MLAVLRQLQRFDPAGVGARDLGECLALQLAPLPDDTPGKALALRIAAGPIDRLPKVGIEGIAAELHCPVDDAAQARCSCCARSTRAPARRSAACRRIPTSPRTA